MEFLVTRSSEWHEKRPCKEAYRKVYLHPDVRACPSPEAFDKEVAARLNEASWYSQGDNHRTITLDGRPHICRDFMREGWAIRIDSLDDLIAFYGKYGDIVITGRDGSDLMTIEIYDSYRE